MSDHDMFKFSLDTALTLKEITETLCRMQAQLDTLQEAVEYRNWCGAEMPGLIQPDKPKKQPEPSEFVQQPMVEPLNRGERVEVIGRLGAESLTWCGAVPIGSRGTIIDGNPNSNLYEILIDCGQTYWIDKCDLMGIDDKCVCGHYASQHNVHGCQGILLFDSGATASCNCSGFRVAKTNGGNK